jgi:hypothetical protein
LPLSIKVSIFEVCDQTIKILATVLLALIWPAKNVVRDEK